MNLQLPGIVRGDSEESGWSLRGFNRLFDGVTVAYGWTVGKLPRVSVIVLLVYDGLLGLTQWRLGSVSAGFHPEKEIGKALIPALVFSETYLYANFCIDVPGRRCNGESTIEGDGAGAGVDTRWHK